VWAYDAADRLMKLPTGTTLAYDNADELTTAAPSTGSATTYTYDRRGNRITTKIGTAAATTYAYNQANQLISYTTPTGSKSIYTYDGTGLRATKTPAGGSKLTMTWDPVSGGVPLLLGDTVSSYIYGPADVPIEQIRGTTPTWLHGDQLDSTVLITNATGTVADRYSYNPYGQVVTHTGTTTAALQYNGQYADAESGLIYLRARYYDPATGQSITVDPLLSLSAERYGYASGNPLASGDPTGLIDWWGVAAGVAGGVLVAGTVACMIVEPCGLAEVAIAVGTSTALAGGVAAGAIEITIPVVVGVTSDVIASAAAGGMIGGLGVAAMTGDSPGSRGGSGGQSDSDCPSALTRQEMQKVGGLEGDLDKKAFDVLRARGGGAGNVRGAGLQDDMGQWTVRDLARAAKTNRQADRWLKMIKQAGTQGKGGK